MSISKGYTYPFVPTGCWYVDDFITGYILMNSRLHKKDNNNIKHKKIKVIKGKILNVN